jgi:hypothetical protein
MADGLRQICTIPIPGASHEADCHDNTQFQFYLRQGRWRYGEVETATSKLPIVTLGSLRGHCAIWPSTPRTAARMFPQDLTIGSRRTVLTGRVTYGGP